MRRHLTFANVAAGLALFFSLAGGAYAAATIDGSDVVNESLTGKDLKNNSIKAKDVDGIAANITVRTGPQVSGSIVAAATARCLPGEDLVSGGYQSSGNTPIFTVTDAPAVVANGPSTTWQVAIAAITPGQGVSISVLPFALCAS